MGGFKEIHIMMGLPGSGKTYYIRHHLIDETKYINIDLDIFTSCDKYERLKRWLTKEYNHLYSAVIDGRCFTKPDLNNIIKCFIGVNCCEGSKIIIHHWIENRELCEENYSKRDDLEFNSNSISMIHVSAYHQITEMDVKKILNDNGLLNEVKVIYHIVPKISELDKILNRYSNDSSYIQSESWSTGGTCSNWMGHTSVIAPDPVPEFWMFDNLMLEICPNITFLQYKKLYKECVIIENYSENDYYGGYESFSYYRCDKEHLKELIEEMKFIKEV